MKKRARNASIAPPKKVKKEVPKRPEGWRPRTYRCLRGMQHHWFVTSPAGRYSRGTCGNCGRSRLFRNSWPSGYIKWLDESWDRRREEARRLRIIRKARQRARLETR